jgi:hypothetical protein
MIFPTVAPQLFNTFKDFKLGQIIGGFTDLSSSFSNLAANIAKVMVFSIVDI